VDLLAMVSGDYRDEHRAGIEPFVNRIETFRTTARTPSFLAKASRRALDHLLAGGAEAASLALAARVRELMTEHPYDAVVVAGRRPYPVADAIGSTPLVTDLCDATSSRLLTNLAYASPPRQVMLRYQIGVARKNERRLIATSQHLFFASARDRDEVLDGLSAAVPDASVLPNGVEVDFWRRSTESLGDEVAFSGAMHYAPNDDAARFLIDQVMPHVWAVAPETRVRIVGRDPSAALQAMTADPRVVVTGFVDDVRPHLERAAVYAAPLRFASGIQNKLLEAMAMEIPVITSPVAADGLRGHGVEPPIRVVQNEPEAFAREVRAALERARTDPSPDAGARRFVAEHFCWDRAVRILEDVLEDVRRAA